MTREYEQVREDLSKYFDDGNSTKDAFCKAHGISNATLWRFLNGAQMGNKRRDSIMKVACKVIYNNTNKEVIVQEEPVKESEVYKDISLDTTITKLIDRKIEETMKQIAELETKVKNLEASRDILKELLD